MAVNWTWLLRLVDRMTKNEKVNYSASGVNLARGDSLAREIVKLAGQSKVPEVIDNPGGFAALASLPSGYLEPLLVTSCEGVGSKLMLAKETTGLENTGVDLVAMCVNDLLTTGAQPLLFLDYLASSRLDRRQLLDFVRGVLKGCKLAGAALVGGECAEMPGLYPRGEFDAAGFALGVVEKSKLLGRNKVSAGDQLLGLGSSGLHSNGFSLIRKLLKEGRLAPEEELAGRKLLKLLLEPTLIYCREILDLLQENQINAIAHITGGGIADNLSRILPSGTRGVVDTGAWPCPDLFGIIAERGEITIEEMFKVFNMGIGMVLAVPAEEATAVITKLKKNFACHQIGQVEADRGAEKPEVLLEGL